MLLLKLNSYLNHEITVINTEVVIMTGERLEWVDALKGIAIIGVVISHIGLFYDIFEKMHSFNAVYLPAFVFVSGYLFNWEKYKTKKWLFIQKRALQLLLPLYATGVFALIFQYAYYLAKGHALALKFWTYNPFTVLVHILQVDLSYYSWFHSVWFLSALFLCEITFFCILYLIKSDQYRLLTSILLASPALFFFSHTPTPFFFAPAFAGLIFYAAGYMARKYNMITQSNLLVLVIVCCIYVFVCSSQDVLGVFVFLGSNHPVTWYLGTLAGSVFLSMLLFHLYTHNITSKFLEYMGKNSLFIMLVNIPVLFSLQRLVDQSHLPIYPKGIIFAFTMITIVGMLQIKNIFKQRIRVVHTAT